MWDIIAQTLHWSTFIPQKSWKYLRNFSYRILHDSKALSHPQKQHKIFRSYWKVFHVEFTSSPRLSRRCSIHFTPQNLQTDSIWTTKKHFAKQRHWMFCHYAAFLMSFVKAFSLWLSWCFAQHSSYCSASKITFSTLSRARSLALTTFYRLRKN